MKKYIYTIGILVFCLQTCSSYAQQLRLGLEGGLSYPFPRVVSDKTFNNDYTDPKGKPGFNAGLNLNYNISIKSQIIFKLSYDRIKIEDKFILLADMQGAFMGGIYNKNRNESLNFELCYGYIILKRLTLFTGITLRYLLSSKTNTNKIIASGQQLPEWLNNDYFEKVCLELPLGLRYDFKRLYIKAQYSFGLNPAYEIEDIIKEYHNVFALNIGYYFKLKNKKSRDN